MQAAILNYENENVYKDKIDSAYSIESYYRSIIDWKYFSSKKNLNFAKNWKAFNFNRKYLFN